MKYQLEWINLWHRTVNEHVCWLWVEILQPFETNRVKICKELQGRAGTYDSTDDIANICFAYSFHIPIITHEILHGFASSHREWIDTTIMTKTGFRISSIEWKNYSSWRLINEWITESIVKILATSIKEKIWDFLSEHKRIREVITNVIKESNKEDVKTEYYHPYKDLVKLVTVLVDLLTYKRMGKRDLDFLSLRNKIWEQLEVAYFTRENAWLESICNELDSSWRLYPRLMWMSQQEQAKKVVWGISLHIQETYNPLYL